MFSFFARPSRIEKTIRREIARLSQSVFAIDDVRMTPDGQAIVVLTLLSDVPDTEARRQQIEFIVSKLPSVKKSMVIITGDKRPSSPAAISPAVAVPVRDVSPLPPTVIAVASGKGGVGKSTVAVNLAMALSAMGKKVGILDADIYGPSLPRLLGVVDKKAGQGPDGRLIPIEAHGVKAMSMGFMVSESAPMIWRGPMAQSALLQMIRDVNWDGVEILVIDMPPGTGDIHLTLAQRVPLSGGVVVSTPQDIALIDARKGLEMFKKVAVPILGIVENMSYYCCPNCGHREDIFGHGGARAEAEKIGVPFLGEIPLHSIIRQMSDVGTPIIMANPDGAEAAVFRGIAEKTLSALDVAGKPAPTILIED